MSSPPDRPAASSAVSSAVSSAAPSAALAADLAGLAWFEVDGDHLVRAWSAGAAAITGFTPEESVGLPCIAVVRCHRCLSGCRIFDAGHADGAVTLYRKDGQAIEVRKVGHALRDASGAVAGAVEVLVPQAAAADRQHRIDLVAAALGRIWLAADADCLVVDASAGLVEATGWTVDEMRGKPLAALLGGELWAEGSPLRLALERGERREGLYARLHTASGERRAVSVSAARGADGRVHVMVRSQAEHREELRGYTAFEGMVARSPAMLRIFQLVEVLGDSDATALIWGESGTGKELVARALHNRSNRASGPFVAVNCGALPAELLEAELFGHVRGAFTGAVRDRVGRFELARGGTLFLDEIGDLPRPLQVKLLRVLEDRTFQRVGESTSHAADVRVIAATNVDLQAAVADKRFRDDLYYRLRVLPITVPPLRERPEDLAPLVQHLLDRIGRHQGRALALSPSAMRALLAWRWPGNVRELENALEYATAVCDGQTIHEGDLPAELRQGGPAEASAPADPPPAGADPGERAALVQALERAHYRRAEAARLLGMSRTTLWRKLKQHGLDG